MKEKKNQVTAVAYARTASMSQNGDGNAIANQFQQIYDYAQSNNIKIIKSYCDVAVSGMKVGPELDHLLKDTYEETLKPSAVIVAASDRISRKTEITLKVMFKLKSKNIKIITVNISDNSTE